MEIPIKSAIQSSTAAVLFGIKLWCISSIIPQKAPKKSMLRILYIVGIFQEESAYIAEIPNTINAPT